MSRGEHKVNKICLLAFGGNLPSSLGAPAVTLGAAIQSLNAAKIRLCAVSRFYQTPCFPAGAGPDYVNAAAAVKTSLSPHELLARLHEIEARFGRERVQRWGMRTLDIDLLAVEGLVLPDAQTQIDWQALSLTDQTQKTPQQLILPHPRLQDRAFVLGPLKDIAPHWRHPLIGRTVAQMYNDLPQTDIKALHAL